MNRAKVLRHIASAGIERPRILRHPRQLRKRSRVYRLHGVPAGDSSDVSDRVELADAERKERELHRGIDNLLEVAEKRLHKRRKARVQEQDLVALLQEVTIYRGEAARPRR